MNDMPSCFSTKVRKAKKTHKCCECRQQINPGDEYRYSSGIWDSEPESFKQCLTCAAIMDVALHINQEKDYWPESGPGFGDLVGWVIEELDSYPDQISRFEFNGNPTWLKQMERYSHENTTNA